MHQGTNLTQFLIEEQRDYPDSRGDFTALINDIGSACKTISHAVRRGALAGVLGSAGTGNIQGEVQKKLDIIANEALLKSMEWTGHLAGMASEEMDEIYSIPTAYPRGKYLLIFDPLDGSSNIDNNLSIGTIFSVLRSPNEEAPATDKDFLQPGTEQVCAGYALYGPSTMLVLTTGSNVNGFTLDPGIGEFILTHPDIRIPADTQEFAINTSNQRHWEKPVQSYISDCLAGSKGPRGKDFNMRWVASMVAEIHRLLMRGGVFMYPRDTKDPTKAGRLRLMYEANPMAMLIEKAGGVATTGYEPILEVAPEEIHQRVPVIMGSSNEVTTILRYHAAELDAASGS